MHGMMLRTEISSVGKDTGITVKSRLGQVRHLSAQIYLPKGRTGNGIPISVVLRHSIHQPRQPIH